MCPDHPNPHLPPNLRSPRSRLALRAVAAMGSVAMTAAAFAQSGPVTTHPRLETASITAGGNVSSTARFSLVSVVDDMGDGTARTGREARVSFNAALLDDPPHILPPVRRQMLDFDRVGRANLYLRDTASATPRALLGRFVGVSGAFEFVPAPDPGRGWAVLGAAAVNGTGTSALISRNAGSDVRIDFAGSQAPVVLRRALPDWQAEAFADFDGDGKVDILWRYNRAGTNDAGVTFAWYLTGDARAGTAQVDSVLHRGGAPLNWSLVGACDFEGDGRADVLWRSPTGELRLLTSNSNRGWTNQRIGVLPPGYEVLKIGDVDGDGLADLVLANAAGELRAWLMRGAQVQADVVLPRVNTQWTFFAASDFDGNGTLDLLWMRPDRSIVGWFSVPGRAGEFVVRPGLGFVPDGFVSLEP